MPSETVAEFLARMQREFDADDAPYQEDWQKLINLAEQLEAEAKSRTLDYLGQLGQLSEELERMRAALREIHAAAGNNHLIANIARAALEDRT